MQKSDLTDITKLFNKIKEVGFKDSKQAERVTKEYNAYLSQILQTPTQTDCDVVKSRYFLLDVLFEKLLESTQINLVKGAESKVIAPFTELRKMITEHFVSMSQFEKASTAAGINNTQ